MKHTWLWLLIVLTSSALYELRAQKPIADSIRKELANSPSPKKRIALLIDLAYDLYDFDDSAAMKYSHLALKEAKAIKDPYGLKNGYCFVGLGHYGYGDYRNALSNFKSSDSVTLKNDKGIAIYNLTLMGNVYRDLAEFDSALYFYKEALARPAKDERAKVAVYRNRAELYTLLWRNKEAIQDLQKAESMLTPGPEDVYNRINIFSVYGRAYENLFEYDKAKDYFYKMCSLADKNLDYFNGIKCFLNQADLSYRKGDFVSALKYCFDALEILNTNNYNYPPQRVEILIKIGESYEQIAQYDLALKYLFEALKFAERYDLQYHIGASENAIAWIYKDQMRLDISMEYVDRAEAICRAIGDRNGVSRSENVRGLVYLLKKDYDKSMAEFEKSIRIRREIGNQPGVSASIFNMSLIYEAKHQYEKALASQYEALKLDEKASDRQGLGISYNSMARLLISMGKLAEAEKYLNMATQVAYETKSRMVKRNVYGNFAALYEAKGDYKNALKNKNRYQEVNDSIYSDESNLKMAEMQALYQVEKKEQALQLLNQQQRIQEIQISRQQTQLRQKNFIIIAAILALALALVIVVIGYRYYRDKNKANVQLTKLNKSISEQKEEIQAQSEELIEANQTIAQINKQLEFKVEERTKELKQAYKELDTFFYRSSHDFRRPLTTFLGLAEVAKITVKDPNSLELFERVRDTATNLDKMLQKLQSISDVGTQQMVFKEVDLKGLIQDASDEFRTDLNRKNIRFFINYDLYKPFLSYPVMMKIIMENIVENAVNFAGASSPFIRVDVFGKDGDVHIRVEDNGQGIRDEYKDRIFEMYFRANEQSKGNGLGLYINRKAVEKLNGRIEFNSHYGSGSVFTVILPPTIQ